LVSKTNSHLIRIATAIKSNWNSGSWVRIPSVMYVKTPSTVAQSVEQESAKRRNPDKVPNSNLKIFMLKEKNWNLTRAQTANY
jgi:hypothetical protein